MVKMKDSGIEWIGEIPEDWTITKIKYISDKVGDGLHGTPIFSDDSEYFFINGTNLGNKYILIKENTQTVSESEYLKYRLNLSNKTILLSLNGTIGNVSRYNNEKIILGKSAGYITINENNIYINYLIYFLKNPSVHFFYDLSMSGTTIKNLSLQTVRNLYITIPTADSQKRIADFLDVKCAKIDSLKSDIEKQIESLEQYKKSVITEAVTRGINPDLKMKDSGIEWIGEIPEHWEIHPIYYYFEERKHKNSLCKEQNLLSLSYGNVIRKDINALGGLLPESFNTYNIIEKDDIVIRPTDLQNDKRSLRTGLCKEHGIITSAYITLKPKKNVNSQFYHYLLHSYDIEKVFYNMGNGVRQGLNYSEFKKLLVISPTFDEQKNIVEYLDSKCLSIDNIINSKKQQLEKLEEYKKSLIFEYVTGKKEI